MVQLILYTIRLVAPLPEFARVSRLIFLGGLDDALELLWSLGPHERLGVLVVLGDVIQQELLELALRRVDALRQTSPAKDAEEAFDHVNPGGMCGCVVEVHPRMSFQPALGCFVFVNVEVVKDHVQLPFGKAPTTSFMKRRKFTEVRRCLTWATTSPLAISRAASRVLVGPTSGLLRTQWQQRLGTVQRLDAGLHRRRAPARGRAGSSTGRRRPAVWPRNRDRD